MSTLEFHQFFCRSDNFGVLVHDTATGETASIDAPNADAVRRALKDRGWSLSHIFTTHHHGDHVEGNLALKSDTGCRIIGPAREASKIPGIDDEVGEGDEFEFAGHAIRVLETPGHTAGHISYWIPSTNTAFVGDTLFAMGCGRLFEGSPETMWASLSKLAALPAETTVYCGHEYTLANARFALTIEPDNAALKTRSAHVEQLRAQGKPTLPTTIADELATNPFLRGPGSPAIRKRLGLESAGDAAVFGEIRRRKDAA